ncbi:PREDICTED: uncharacterized protein LOC106110631 isoform X1 [Papilio polytes]|uniref:uncharacterized protein LOC106110631 isoform X1 n=1 Tax=Papilio polytes TaxID=76194 RepID=UPI00067607E9|nr:PREDICTED: uncharacterized protein LOC106110631 isoform X1 [Papilio polytes]
MDITHSHNQSYWFVLREDQSNVIFSSNNFAIQNPQSMYNTMNSRFPGQDTRSAIEALDNRQYIQINEAPLPISDEPLEHCNKDALETLREETFWDKNKIKLLLTLCLDQRYKNVNKDKFLWNEIALNVGTSPGECDKKFRNLRRTYIRLLKKKRLGKDIKWIHYNICEEVFKDCKSLSPSILETWEDTKIRRMLNLYLENINRFRNPDCLQKDVWKEIALQLNTTEYNCYHKFKNLKRTYFNWLERTRDTGKLIKWPYRNYFERIFYNYNPNVGPWDRNKIQQLIAAYGQIAHKFLNPRMQKKELWKEISHVVGESPSNCDRKFRNLKQTYIRLKMRAETGRSITKWYYYKDFESIYENINYNSSGSNPRLLYKNQDVDYVHQLLGFYLNNKEKFRDPLMKKKNLWRQIGPTLGLSTEECDKKFRNLKQTYIRLAEKKRATGKCNQWPYYTYFEQIYDQPKVNRNRECNHRCAIDNVTLTEIKTAVRSMRQNEGKDKFEKLVQVIEDSNAIQRERNNILHALLNRH